VSDNTPISGPSRRDVLGTSAKVAAVSALAGVAIPPVHAGEDNEIKVALIGCGGRGGGAAENALSTKGPIKLVALVDVFKAHLDEKYRVLKRGFEKQVDVPEEQKFIGFDGYRKAMDCLKPGDVAILTTPPAFRWVMFKYAIEKGLNVFMEKPITVDGPTTKKMLELGEASVKKGLKVGVGLMCRHCTAREELHSRIKKGQIGDIVLMRAYRMAGYTGSAHCGPRPKGEKSELLYQIKNFHAFLWASGGAFSDFLIHNIDECCWMKDAWPIKAQGLGGRHYRKDFVDQNFDSYAVEYTFADGSKLQLDGRTIPGCHNEFASYVHGTKGSGVISTSGHTPARCKLYKGQLMTKENITWPGLAREPNPYQTEWDRLIEAIRKDKAHNEVKRGAEASLVTSMGRMACHTGQVITYQQMLECKHEFAPKVDELTMESAAPIQADDKGRYAVPQPGIIKDREF